MLITTPKNQEKIDWRRFYSWLIALYAFYYWIPARAAENHQPKPNTPPSLLQQLQQLRYSTKGSVSIEYRIPKDDYVTLVIEDEQGRRIRNLIADYPRKAGRNIDYWDGRDDEGRLVSPGTYRVRGLYHGEFDVLYEFSYGSPGNPPWPTGSTKGAWLSNHTNPIDVLADEERVYVAAPFSEGPDALMALDYQGNKIWGGLAWGYGGFMARAGKYLYILSDPDARPARHEEELNEEARIGLIRVDPKTGQVVPFSDQESQQVIATWNIERQGAPRRNEGYTIAHHAHDADWAGVNAQGLAALGDILYASLHFSNKLLKISPETGKVIGEIPLDSPAGLAAAGRRLLAISGTRVVSVDPESGQTTPIITSGLKAPIGLAIGRKGQIYVSDWADQMCIKVFSPQGEFLSTIGKPGGRPWFGPYDPQGMLLPRGISIDTQDRLWVAEDDVSPRRISVWDTHGRLVLEKLGRPYYGGSGTYVFPDRPNHAFVLGNLIELDWKKGRWRVLGTPWRGAYPDALLGLNYDSEISRVIQRNGRRFLVHSGNGRYLDGVVMISEWRDDRAFPLAAMGPVYAALPKISPHWRTGFEPSSLFADHLWVEERMNSAAPKAIPWFFHGPRAGDHRALFEYSGRIRKKAGITGVKGRPAPDANFSWSDLNRNGRIDEEEIQFYATPDLKGPFAPPWHPEPWSHGVVDDQLNLYLSAIHGKHAYHWRLPVARWSENGVPIYGPERAALIAKSPYLGEAAWTDGKGNLLAFGNIANPSRNKLRDPLVMYRPDGVVAWTYPSPYSGVHGSHSAPKARRGLLIGPLGVMGEAHLPQVGQIFALHTNMGQAVLFTADGLYIGALFQDTRSASAVLPDKPWRGMSLMNISNGGEWFGGQFFQRSDSGQVYVVGGRSSADISRVTGLETIVRLPPKTIEFTREQYLSSGKERIVDQRQTLDQTPQLQIAALQKAPKLPSPAHFDWNPASAAHWRFDAGHAAAAAWGYDDKQLYLCFRDVEDSTPMINQGDDPQRLFKTGDAVVFELRTQAGKNGGKVMPGDIRLLFSVYQGRSIAVLYRYHVAKSEQPVVFETAVRTRIDQVSALQNAKIQLERRKDSYTLCAAVPLSDLDFKPQTGRTYLGDFGIIYSDRAGKTNVLRMYWANQATGLVNDLALEARIDPSRWGRFEVK